MWGLDGEKKPVFRDFGGLTGILRLFVYSEYAGSDPHARQQHMSTSVGPGYLMVGAKKLIWNSATYINVNTPDMNLHTITSYVTVGKKVQWKWLRDMAMNTVLCSQIGVN